MGGNYTWNSKVGCRNIVFSKLNLISGIVMRFRFTTFEECDFRDAQLQRRGIEIR